MSSIFLGVPNLTAQDQIFGFSGYSVYRVARTRTLGRVQVSGSVAIVGPDDLFRVLESMTANGPFVEVAQSKVSFLEPDILHSELMAVELKAGRYYAIGVEPGFVTYKTGGAPQVLSFGEAVGVAASGATAPNPINGLMAQTLDLFPE